MKTTVLKGNQVKREWHLVDLKGQTLGRVCTQIAGILIGKSKPTFSYHRDDGDYVVAVNASDIKVTGKKPKEKLYRHHTHWAGGLKEFTFNEMMQKDSRRVIIIGVYGMLPKNKLRDKRISRLKVFVGPEHKYTNRFNEK
jgi:large subunit ribosomal protein L13